MSLVLAWVGVGLAFITLKCSRMSLLPSRSAIVCLPCKLIGSLLPCAVLSYVSDSRYGRSRSCFHHLALQSYVLAAIAQCIRMSKLQVVRSLMPCAVQSYVSVFRMVGVGLAFNTEQFSLLSLLPLCSVIVCLGCGLS